MGFVRIYDVKHDDIVYTVLPLYHSAGGMIGVGLMFESGCTIVLKNKFRVSEFWKYCVKYNATVIQYIGELCRYLVSAPKTDNDRKHKVRIAIGNGLRPEIWNTFQDRFNIPEIGEFYASTEGNASCFNHCTTKGDRGAVGHNGAILQKINNLRIVKFDTVTEQIIRGRDGFAILCKYGEVGELLGEIKPDDPLGKFDGYHGNPEATAKKIAQNVFKKGDLYFRTGDLLKQDSRGYFYFVDRIGDTFRWKGENVSTTEVTEVLSTFPGITEVNVYGVSIPGKDGRACMAAMVFSDINFDNLAKHCRDNLPAYAMPLFLRKMPEIQVTSTFKHQKVDLQKQGCDVTGIIDPIWWYDTNKLTYVPFGTTEHSEILKGKAKL